MTTDQLIINIGAIISIFIGLSYAVIVYRSAINLEVNRWLTLAALLTVWLVLSWSWAVNTGSFDLAGRLFSQTVLLLPLAAVILQVTVRAFHLESKYYHRLSNLVLIGSLIGTALAAVFVGRMINTVTVSGFGLDYYFQLTGWGWLMVGLAGSLLLAALAALIQVWFQARSVKDSVKADRILYCWLACLLLLPIGFNIFSTGGGLLPAGIGWFGIYLPLLIYGTSWTNVITPFSALIRGSVYLLLVVLVSVIFVAINAVSFHVRDNVAELPWWLLSVFWAVAAVAVGGLTRHQLKKVEALKYEFVTVMTHKFRTPLTRIKWSINFFYSADTQEDKDAAIKEIEFSAGKLVELTNTLIDVSKVQGGGSNFNPQLRNLNLLVQEVANSVRHRMEAKAIQYRFTFDDAYSKVLADPERLVFALQIMFENAVSYTPGGGSIQVHIGLKEDQVVFSITDSGIGLSQEELPYLFSQFYRTEKAKLMDTEGVGIGLNLAKQIVERHGGQIWATSPGPNRGSTFYISLPRAN